MSSPIDYAFDPAAAIARIVLDEPERGNPVDPASAAALLSAVRRAEADAARVVVLEARGRFFSVGGDLGVFAGEDDPGRFIDDLATVLHRSVAALTRLPAVVIAAVHGPAAGAGVGLAAAADLVVAGRSASFTMAYTKVGLSPDGGASMLVHTLGLHRTLRLALLNDALGAEEALAAGLVARVVDDEALAETVTVLAEQLARGPVEAFAATKRLVRDAADQAPETRLAAEAHSIGARAHGAEGREGVAAFAERRRPDFS